MTERASEGGYSLLELIVCVALLIACGVFALLLLPGLARASQAGLLRAAATSIARNAIERARAASAYYPAGAVGNPAQRAATTADHAWALAPSASYTAAAHVHRGFCASAAATVDVPMNVRLSYDAPSDVLTVTVTYPQNACAPAAQSSVVLSAQLAPAAYVPQTRLPAAIADPAVQ